MEGAGIALAVIPLVVEIFKSYRTVRDRFRALAHADGVIQELMLIYRLAMDSFRNECELLLSTVVYDNQILAEMMDDPEHDAWQDPRLDARLCDFLKSNNETFRFAFNWIKAKLDSVGLELARLHDEPGTEKTSSLLKPAKDAKLSFDISRKEHGHRDSLVEIEQWIERIGKLREQRCELRDVSSALSSTPTSMSVPSEYSEIRLASCELHRFLQGTLWPNTGRSCNEYKATLALGLKHTKVGAAQLCTVIARKLSTTPKQDEEELEPTIRLHVQSLKTSTSPLVQRPTKELGVRGDRSLNTYQNLHQSAASTTIVHEADGPALGLSGAGGPGALHEPTLDSAYGRIRSRLNKDDVSPPSQLGSYLGYTMCVVPNGSLRLWFYECSRTSAIRQILPIFNEEAKPVIDLLQNLGSQLEQFILAHRLAKATLQYHSSPWLGEDWNLEEIYYFDSSADQKTGSFENRLEGLHFSTRFSKLTSSALSHDERSRLQNHLGIRSIPLAKLGVALLQILCKTDRYSTKVSEHAVVTAREALECFPTLPSPLDRQLLEMARKCIHCDFSVGSDLDSIALQAAVYNQIVRVLDSNIAPLKGFMEEIAEPIL